jgi:hypothetical protein
MELRDMLDVLHFFFETDSRYSSAEEAEGVSATRTALYEDLYKDTYKYKMKSSASRSSNSSFSPSTEELKPYIPPTEFNPEAYNPFGEILDAPIG